MTSMTEGEWHGVQQALCAGGLRDYIDLLLTTRSGAEVVLPPALISDANRRIMDQAWDDGDGHTITLVANIEEPPWFVGLHEGFEVCEGVEIEGVLYTITHASGGGLVSVIVGRGLIDNDAGTVFHSIPEAKAYIQGLASR